MNAYIEGFLKLNLNPDDSKDCARTENPGTQIQKCTILKSSDVTYSHKLEASDKREKCPR